MSDSKIEIGARVVIDPDLFRGEVIDKETVLGEPDDLWSEVHWIVKLDDNPFPVVAGERSLRLEEDEIAATETNPPDDE